MTCRITYSSTDGSQVTLDFTALSENETKLEWLHIKFIDEETRNKHEGGWGNILDVLSEIVGA